MLEAWCLMILSTFAVGPGASASSSDRGKPVAPNKAGIRSSGRMSSEGSRHKQELAACKTWQHKTIVFLVLDGNFLCSQGKGGGRKTELEKNE